MYYLDKEHFLRNPAFKVGTKIDNPEFFKLHKIMTMKKQTHKTTQNSEKNLKLL